MSSKITTARKFVEEHRHLIKVNGIITELQLCTYFRIMPPDVGNVSSLSELYKKLNAFALDRTNAYSKINRVISCEGLVIRQVTKGNIVSYVVQSQADTEKRIKSYRNAAQTKTTQAKRLRAGYAVAKTHGWYTNPRIPGIEA